MKRSAENKIAEYRKKIQKLESIQYKRRKRVIVYSDSSDSGERSDTEPNIVGEQVNIAETSPCNDITIISPQNEKGDETAVLEHTLPALEPEVLLALGELIPDKMIYGDNIHPDLAQRWAPILRKGLTDKDQKERIIKEHAVPQNCKLFRPPILNPEIAAAVSEFARLRDKKIESSQQHLGIGLSAISRAMTILLTSDDKLLAIKSMSDASRILCDLHASETQTRIKSLTQGLDKAFINLIQDSERDEMLFGTDLPEKIKASKAIERQSCQIKKPENKSLPGPSSSRSRPQVNWRGPSRSTNRGGGRGGSRKNHTSLKPPSSQNNNFTPTRVWNRPPRAGPRT